MSGGSHGAKAGAKAARLLGNRQQGEDRSWRLLTHLVGEKRANTDRLIAQVRSATWRLARHSSGQQE
jgi:hypothetical protein